MESQRSIIKNFTLPIATLGAEFFIGGKRQGRSNISTGTGLLTIGTPRLRTKWNLFGINLNTEEALKATKTNLKLEGEAAAVYLVTVIELLLTGIPVVKTQVNTLLLPSGKAATNSKREAWLTGSVNLPQPVEIPPGQTLYMKMYLELISAGEPFSTGDFKVDTSNVPIEAVFLYNQIFSKQ